MKSQKSRGPRPIPLTVSQAQSVILDKIERRPSSPQQLVKRAAIIRCGASGVRNEEIARELKVSVPMVILWRARWRTAEERLAVDESAGDEASLEQAITAVLADARRSGAPVKFSAEAVCQLMAVACEAPEASGRPVTEWTPRELADEVVKRNIVSSISVRQTGRFLKMRLI